MKKVLISSLIIAAALLPAAAFAAVSISVSPSKSLNFSNFTIKTAGAPTCDGVTTGYGYYIFDPDGSQANVDGEGSNPGCVPAGTTMSIVSDFAINLVDPGLYGHYAVVQVTVDPNVGSDVYGSSCNFQLSAPNDPGDLSACLASKVGDPALAQATINYSKNIAMDLPIGLTASLSQNVGGQLGDSGTLLFLALCAGIPLAFFVIWELIGLLPDKSREQLDRLHKKYRK